MNKTNLQFFRNPNSTVSATKAHDNVYLYNKKFAKFNQYTTFVCDKENI